MKTKETSYFTCQALSEKDIKCLKVFSIVRKKGVVSRTEISKVTGINIVSISNYINHYIDKEVMLETGLDVSTGGRKPELVELNTRRNFTVGLDVGNDEIRAIVTNFKGDVLHKAHIARGAGLSGEVVRFVEEVIKASKLAPGSVKAIGVGLPEGQKAAFADELARKSGAEVFTGSYILCAAFCEKYLNRNVEAENMLYIHSYLGRGIVIRGESQISADGETAGHSSVSSEESKYLRPWDKALGMVSAARREIAKGVGTAIVDLVHADVDKITEDVVLEAAGHNDDIASGIVESIGINLGLRIAYLVNLFNPEAVVVGGGIEKAGEVMLSNIRKMINRLAFDKQSKAVKVVSGLSSDDVVGTGAALLAARELFLRA